MNQIFSITADTLDQLPAAAQAMARAMQGHSVFALQGEMGAGKTTFVNALMNHLGVTKDATGSPSFAIVNQYTLPSGDPVYHFDLYRLQTPEEVYETGFLDYTDSGHLCLIEWPDRAGSLMPDDALTITITVDPITDARTITLCRP